MGKWVVPGGNELVRVVRLVQCDPARPPLLGPVVPVVCSIIA